MTSSATHRVNQRLAAAVIAQGGSASHLTMSTNQLLAALHNAISADPDLTAKRADFFDLLQATRNALSDNPDQSAKTTGWETLLDEILNLAEGGGEPEPEVPAWVQALQALAADPDDLLFAYNFASGGTGQGWDGTNGVTLTAAQGIQAPPTFGAWDDSLIIDGVGLAADNGNFAASAIALPGIALGATLFMEAELSAPAAVDTDAFPWFHIFDENDTFDGGLEVRFSGATDTIEFGATNGGGGGGATYSLPIATLYRAVQNYTVDGSDIVGSINGRANVSGGGLEVTTPPNMVFARNRIDGAPEVQAHIKRVAVFALQSSLSLPAMSAV